MKIPIGIDHFGDLIRDKYTYVDKTLFIEEVIEQPAKVQLITRPRRFGKTLNMSMLAHFFDDRENNKALFEGLAIRERPCFEQCGSRPAIFLSFKDLKRQDYDTFLERYQKTMARLFADYAYIEEHLSPFERNEFVAFCGKRVKIEGREC
jgi:hypothetical protein